MKKKDVTRRKSDRKRNSNRGLLFTRKMDYLKGNASKT